MMLPYSYHHLHYLDGYIKLYKPITTMKQKLLQVSNGDFQVTFENFLVKSEKSMGMIQHMLDEINHLIKQIYHEEM